MDIKTVDDYFYTKEHEWAKVDGNKAKLGITDYAQQKLGDITFVELPDLNKEITQSDVLAGIESVKAASDVYTPLSGKVTAVNNALLDAPELINESPYEKGWIAEIEISAPDETDNLMSSKDYRDYAEGLE